MSILDWPREERPREKLLKAGAGSLSDAELIAIFLRTGIQGKTALDLARELLVFHGSLRALLLTDLEQFSKVSGMGAAKYAQLQASLEMAKRFFREELIDTQIIQSTEACKDYLRLALNEQKREIFACLYLDSQHKVLYFEELFYGTLDSASIYPREVVRSVLQHGAGAVIFCHNHPSGNPEPSRSDIEITQRLSDALALIDVKVLDHFVVAGPKVLSFAERGLWHA